MTEYLIDLPWPDRNLQSNARCHWGKKSRLTNSARGTAKLLATLKGVKVPMPDATIEIEYYPRNLRGDVHNVPSSLKAYIDGIADAMGCDDKRFIVKYPDKFAGITKLGSVIFHIKPKTVILPIAGTIQNLKGAA